MATVDERPAAPSSSLGYALKRLVLGRPLATTRLEHERLGRPTALAIFSSDNMSSVAYATEEILRVLIPAVGVAAFALVMPVTISVVVIEAILIFSYRQTIKAYPSAGGAYIVTKDNLGLMPAQLAGVALLVDYVLTVAVSTAAGVQAISTVVPLSVPVRVVLSLVFIWLIAYGNLLGVRESGRIFAVPTYVFIGSLYLTCGVGLFQVLGGHLHAFSIPGQQHAGGLSAGTGAVALFIVLRAFASGGAAVTGVEAISNGVPAFRKPEWRNAQVTLMWMGAVLSGSFLTVSYLAHRLHVIPVADESKSVLGQIGEAVYGSSALGHALFLLLQVSTTLILILAANTSFADFPRLASFHAGDAFMPRQLIKRGHRLVFSNGILALAGAASLLIVVFRASVTAMIPLYALGVFTSFTLSQSGMAKRHLRLREKGWRLGLLVNGLGAVSTLVVAVIIAIVKFKPAGEFGGAWMIILAVPLLVYALVRVNRTYEAEESELLDGAHETSSSARRRHVAVVPVNELDAKTLHAVQYALTVRPAELHVVRFDRDPAATEALRAEWQRLHLPVGLEIRPCPGGDPLRCAEELIRSLAAEDQQVTLILPADSRLRSFKRFRQLREWAGVDAAFAGLDNVSVAVVRGHDGAGHEVLDGRLRMVPRRRHVALILADRVDQSVLKAIRYARNIEASDIRAVHAAADPDRAMELADRWGEYGQLLGIALDVEECPDRNVAHTLARYAQSALGPDSEITVVIPRREYPRAGERLLHDRTSRSIARALRSLPHVDLVVVPYRLRARPQDPPRPIPHARPEPAAAPAPEPTLDLTDPSTLQRAR